MAPGAQSEARIVTESGLEARVAAIAEPVIEGLGFRLVRVRISGRDGLTVQVMAERPDGTMAIEDCEAVSHDLSAVFDVEDPIDREYRLEVSSPGMDRPLVRRSDFERAAGQLARIELRQAVGGKRRFRGTIGPVAGDDLTVVPEAAAGEAAAEPVAVRLDDIVEAKLVLTETLIRSELRAQKRLAREAKEARRAERQARRAKPVKAPSGAAKEPSGP